MKHKFEHYEWIVNVNNRKRFCKSIRLGWWLGKKVANYRKSYGSLRFFQLRRKIVVFLTAFIEANLEVR